MGWYKAHGLELVTVRQVCGIKSDGALYVWYDRCPVPEVFPKEPMWTQEVWREKGTSLYFATTTQIFRAPRTSNLKALCQ